MAMVLTGGHDAFSSLVYGQPDPSFSNFIQQFNHVAPQYVLPAAQQFFESMRGTFKTFDENMVVRRSKATIRKMANLWQLDGIVPLQNMGQFQQASPTMQRWVMACPDVRNLYLQDNIDGYTDTYVNTSGKRVGEQDYHYQLAMSGVPVDNADGTETVRFYHAEDELYPGDRKLDHHEKVSIQHTWRNARSLIHDMGFDFTNQSETPTRINFE